MDFDISQSHGNMILKVIFVFHFFISTDELKLPAEGQFDAFGKFTMYQKTCIIKLMKLAIWFYCFHISILTSNAFALELTPDESQEVLFKQVKPYLL